MKSLKSIYDKDDQYYFDLLDKLFPKAVYTKDVIEITIDDGNMKNLMDLIIGTGSGWFNKNIRLKLNMDLRINQTNFTRPFTAHCYDPARLEVGLVSPRGIKITIEGYV